MKSTKTITSAEHFLALRDRPNLGIRFNRIYVLEGDELARYGKGGRVGVKGALAVLSTPKLMRRYEVREGDGCLCPACTRKGGAR